MRYFSTEFPQVKLNSKSEFIAQVVTWLRGTNYSTVLNEKNNIDLDGIAPKIQSDTGEELRFRSFDEDGKWAIGFRHDFPDNDGRLWRTEAVYRNEALSNGQHLIRLRTQCIARIAGAKLESPRKPYLIKLLLTDKMGGQDRSIPVSDQVIFLKDDDSGLILAHDVFLGKASSHLPIIYFSATSSTGWALSNKIIQRLAYNLGGVAHIIIEPSRSFSLRLRRMTDAISVYSGSIGIVLPNRGLVRQFFPGGRVSNQKEAENQIQTFALALRSQMPAGGWDWTELQEQALRQQREREKNQLSANETEALYEEEIKNLRDQIAELKLQSDQSTIIPHTSLDERADPISDMLNVAPEVYPGEIIDRIRAFAKIAQSRIEQEGLDNRSIFILQCLAKLPRTDGLQEILDDIGRSTKDSARMSSDLYDLLYQHGYDKKSQSKHLILEPRSELEGLATITVSTTPSDIRALKNTRKQVEHALGLTKLK